MKLYNISRLGSILSVALVLVGSLLGSVKAQQICFPDRDTLISELIAYFSAYDSGASYDTSTYGPIEDWCFDPTLTNFDGLFRYKEVPANMDLSKWDVKDVTSMEYMFHASSFNGDISQWNVGKVTNFWAMFYSNGSFNQPIGGWDVSSGKNFGYIGSYSAFNQDISCWNVGAGTNFVNMFWQATSFNQDLCPWGAHLSSQQYSNIFTDTGCSNTADPVRDLETNIMGPFCYACTENIACTYQAPDQGEGESAVSDLTCQDDGAGNSISIYTTQAECQAAALAAGLQLGGGGFPFADEHGTKGCYYYKSDHADYANMAFFGTNSDETDTTNMDTTLAGSDKHRLPCPQCAGKDWCLEFGDYLPDATTAAGGVTLIYPASEPTDATNPLDDTQDKYYKVTLMDAATCTTPVASDAGVTAASTAAFALSLLYVNLNIDTSNIEKTTEAGGLATNVDAAAGTFDVKFCAKVDLHSKIEGVAFKVETSETDLTLSFDKTKNFDFTITAAKENRGSSGTDVQVNHDVQGCVCNTEWQCLADDAYSLSPGEYFNFCVYDAAPSTEVTLESLKGVAFKNNDDDALSIPILNDSGEGVGPVVNQGCTRNDATQVTTCAVRARTYAQMYEKVNGGVFTDISGGSKISGTAVLAFTRRRSRRLGGSIVQEEEEKELVEINFGGRVLQQDGSTTPVNDFAVDMNLATPPDRSSVAGSSSSSTIIAFVSLMVGGFVGMMF